MLISREFKEKLPLFINHSSARMWFKEIYGERFMLQGSEVIDGIKIYFYHLIENKEVYIENYKKVKKGIPVTSFDYLNSYQQIEVSEYGFIHVIN